MDFIILIFATGYLTYIITSLDGPFDLFFWLRRATARVKVLDCAICFSFWAALLCLFLMDHVPQIVYALALGGIYTSLSVVLWSEALALIELIHVAAAGRDNDEDNNAPNAT